jgi:serine/threonine protein kinase
MIADRYMLQDEVGHGGMGVVFRAYDVKLGRPIALKMLLWDTPYKSGHNDQLAVEARSASALNHPGIATVYDLVETADEKFIAFEFVEGLTLRKKLAQSRFTVEETVEAGIQLAEALGAAHKCRIIHRDIKPENIMLMPKDEHGWTRLKILDFGLAKITSRPLLPHEAEEISTMTSLSAVRKVVAGTIDYMSPEQLEGVDADARSDVFALGIVLYEMATGVNPFKGATPASTIANILREETLSFLNPGVRGELEPLLRRCLHKRPEERYQSVNDLRRTFIVVVTVFTSLRRLNRLETWSVASLDGRSRFLEAQPFVVGR